MLADIEPWWKHLAWIITLDSFFWSNTLSRWNSYFEGWEHLNLPCLCPLLLPRNVPLRCPRRTLLCVCRVPGLPACFTRVWSEMDWSTLIWTHGLEMRVHFQIPSCVIPIPCSFQSVEFISYVSSNKCELWHEMVYPAWKPDILLMYKGLWEILKFTSSCDFLYKCDLWLCMMKKRENWTEEYVPMFFNYLSVQTTFLGKLSHC